MKRFSTISEFLNFRQLPEPEHPSICVLKVEPVNRENLTELLNWCYDFYVVGLKNVPAGQAVKVKYGQQSYDFSSGKISFVAPGQVISFTVEEHVKEIQKSGWMMLIHPDLLWNTPLAQGIKQYDFWDYSVNEALYLSGKEEEVLVNILQNIERECKSNIDKFSKSIIVSQIESFFNYSDRFYHRQFLTREKAHHEVLERLEQLLDNHFNSDQMMSGGLPSVAGIADSLHLSPKYLSSLLKVLTGLNTQQHIHEKLIDKAKERLSTPGLTISEIAYGLGFEHLQSFSKLFKTKTQMSPIEFRHQINRQ